MTGEYTIPPTDTIKSFTAYDCDNVYCVVLPSASN